MCPRLCSVFALAALALACGEGAECTLGSDCPDDGFYCNGAPSCQQGRCTPGEEIACDDGIACTVDRCSDELEDCVFEPDDGLCDPGWSCVPEQGGCVPECTGDADCPDDGSLCNGVPSCDRQRGVCADGEPLDCDDGHACTLDDCDDALGCVYLPRHDECDPGEICTSGSGCAQRFCALDADCDDGVFCNGEERCEGDLCAGGALPCDDGLACSDDFCDELPRSCRYEVHDERCDDGLPCTRGVCEPDGCRFEPVEDGTPCDDGDPCTAQGACAAGQCAAPPVCEPRNPCESARCVPQGEGHECIYEPKCDDGIDCTLDECHTQTGECSFTPLDERCEDLEPCIDYACLPEQGGCTAVYLTDADCDDGNECSTSDRCIGADETIHCLGTPSSLLSCDGGLCVDGRCCPEALAFEAPRAGRCCCDQDASRPFCCLCDCPDGDTFWNGCARAERDCPSCPCVVR
ncbi:MAG: hypothetical protein JXR96_14165 [Deltaproteobacteria bacterium]|nr:hypothetical protein [Deltaproteobacteria bacterium]